MKPPEWHMERAYRRLAAAKFLTQIGYFEDAFSRLYYAAMEAAHAALSSQGIKLPKSHNGLRNAFRKHVMNPGHVPRDIGITLDHMEPVRKGADYRGLDSATPELEQATKNVEELIEAVRKEFLGDFSPPLLDGGDGQPIAPTPKASKTKRPKPIRQK